MLYSRSLLFALSIVVWCVNPKPLIYPLVLLWFHFGNHKFVFCLWVYFCFLIKFICILFFFFKIPHISGNIWCLSFPFGLTSFSMIISNLSLLLQMARFHSLLWLIFHCIYTPHPLHLFLCRWTFRWLPYLGYCKQKHLTFWWWCKNCIFFFFGHAHGMSKFLNQGSNLHSCDLQTTAVAKHQILNPLGYKGISKDFILKSKEVIWHRVSAVKLTLF